MFAAVRAVHFAAVLLLFGSLAFTAWIARPVLPATAGAGDQDRILWDWLVRFAAGALVVAFASGALWFAFEAANMSGLPMDQALNRDISDAVLNDTLFGHVWKIRFGLAVALAVLLWSSRHAPAGRSGLLLGAVGGPLAGALLAALTWAGHAAAARGFAGHARLAADAVHLLAAGAWLGGLAPLVFLLARARRIASALPIAGAACRRFSMLGVASVTCLVLTGSSNAWYLVGGVSGLLGTHYGRLLLVKLALFALMLALAAINRQRLTPRLPADQATPASAGAQRALGSLWRNASWETVLGLAIVSIVGVLGVTPPGAHMLPIDRAGAHAPPPQGHMH